MSLQQYLWRVRRTDNGLYETEISGTEPTVAPSDGGAIDTSQTVILSSEFTSIVDSGYVNLESTLADNQAIKINASNAAGGIDIGAGTGGITIDTTNSISLDGAAASNFTTTSGNLELRATVALVNIDGGSGINIGSLTEAQPINIGTPAADRTITVGNTTGASQVSVLTGTGGFLVDTASGGGISLDATGASCNFTLMSTGAAQDLTIALTGANDSSIILDSQGTGSDSIRLLSSGGIDIDASAQINLATSQGAGGSITLDATTNNGGVTISTGSQGFLVQTGTGVANIATDATTHSITLNNSTGASKTFIRFGTGGLIKSQPAATSYSDNNQTATISELLTGIMYIDPTVGRTITLPTAANCVSGVSGVEVGDCIEFSIINNDTTNNVSLTVAMGTGGSSIGNLEIPPRNNTADTYKTSGSSIFRLRFTNVTASSEAYTVYRIA